MHKTIPLLVLITFSAANPQITPEIYYQRRESVRAQMGPGGRMVLLTKAITIRNGDVEYKFRPDSDFWYLTGFKESHAVLVLTGEEVRFSAGDRTYEGHEFLFLEAKNPRRERWSGERLGIEQAPEVLAIDQALPIDAFTEALPRLMTGAHTVYVNLNQADLERPLTALAEATLQWVPPSIWTRLCPFRIARSLRQSKKRLDAQARKIRPHNLKLAYKSAGEILDPMRNRKSPQEIELIQQAAEITGQGLVAAMQRVQPGLYEYQVQATIEYLFKDNGAQREGFPLIIASGPNALILHYSESNRQLQPGELLLMDVGAEFDMYTADIARTVPVDGIFSPAQRELYSCLLEVQAAAATALQPGITIKELNRIVKEALKEKGYDQYCIHGVSHWLGLDVHDVGGNEIPAAPGMVLTLEPGIYIPADDESLPQAYRGLGLRLEDDFLVTETGGVMLSKNIPRTVDEIESIMKK
ncbi:MAG: aminopeptidase P N-terminal domain-containing protein [Candidatus Neomarinimicrobiota bacterium]